MFLQVNIVYAFHMSTGKKMKRIWRYSKIQLKKTLRLMEYKRYMLQLWKTKQL
jgi:hypothetical protein